MYCYPYISIFTLFFLTCGYSLTGDKLFVGDLSRYKGLTVVVHLPGHKEQVLWRKSHQLPLHELGSLAAGVYQSSADKLSAAAGLRIWKGDANDKLEAVGGHDCLSLDELGAFDGVGHLAFDESNVFSLRKGNNNLF